MELLALRISKRMTTVMAMQKEVDTDGNRVIQRNPNPSLRHKDLVAKLMHMASDVGSEFDVIFEAVDYLFQDRR